MVRMVATTRIVLPKTRVRLSAGRKNFSNETQLLFLLAGANSIFYGDSLLTTENNQMDDDRKLLSDFSNKDFLKSQDTRSDNKKSKDMDRTREKKVTFKCMLVCF